MTRNHEPIATWMLEDYDAGELSEAGRRRVEAALADDPDVQAQLNALQVDHAQWCQRHDIDADVRQIHRRAGHQGRRRHLQIWAPLSLAAAALFVAIIYPLSLPDTEPPLPRFIVKGPGRPSPPRSASRPRIVMQRTRFNEGTVELPDGGKARAGDTLRVAYVANGRRHGVLVSIDGLGAVQLHYPQAPGSSTRLVGGGETPLDYGYKLDEAPGFERFVLVTRDTEIDVDAVRQAAKKVGADPSSPLPLPSDHEQTSFLVRKGPE